MDTRIVRLQLRHALEAAQRLGVAAESLQGRAQVVVGGDQPRIAAQHLAIAGDGLAETALLVELKGAIEERSGVSHGRSAAPPRRRRR